MKEMEARFYHEPVRVLREPLTDENYKLRRYGATKVGQGRTRPEFLRAQSAKVRTSVLIVPRACYRYEGNLVCRAGFELTTSGLDQKRSNQLKNYTIYLWYYIICNCNLYLLVMASEDCIELRGSWGYSSGTKCVSRVTDT